MAKLNFVIKSAKKVKNSICQTCNTRENECTVCNFDYFMPEDEEKKLDCQKCPINNCDECSGTKNSSKCKSIILLYMKEMKLLNAYVKKEKKINA